MVLQMPDGVDSPVIVEAAFGADLTTNPVTWTWKDITEDVIGDIKIRQGRRPGAQHTEPGAGQLRVGNDDSRYSPLHPASPDYPNVARNTPIRVRLHPDIADRAALFTDTFTRTETDSWGASDSGWMWTVRGDGSIGEETDFDVTGSAATMAVDAVNDERRAYLADLNLPNIDASVTVSFPLPTGAAILTYLTLRNDGQARYLCGVSVATSGAVTAQVIRSDDTGAETTLSTAATGLTHATITALNIRAQAYDATVKVRVWQGATEPATWHIDTTDPDPLTGGQAGVYVYAATGNTNTKPFTVTWDMFTAATMPIRLGGFADAFELDWPDGTDQICHAVIDVAGITRRLAQARPLRSAPVRYIPDVPDTTLIAYWPLEDGPLVTAAQPLVGTGPMQAWTGTHPSGAVVSHPKWGTGNLAGWLPSVLSRKGSGGLSIIYAALTMPSFVNTWYIEFAYNSGTDASITAIDVNPLYLGGDLGWPQLSFDPPNNRLLISLNSEPEVPFDAGDLFNNRPHHIRWTCTQSGANVTWFVYLDGNLNVGTTAGAMTLKPVTRIAHVSEDQVGADVAVGHFAVWTTPPPIDDAVSALMGWTGETAAARVTRLLAEENIPALVYPAPVGADSIFMGPQGVAKLVDLLYECETTDVGLLTEQPFGYRYLPRSGLYNQTATLTLNAAIGDLQTPFRPVYDDRDLRNDIEVRRSGGSTVQAEASGALAPGAATGRYAGGVTVNTSDDEPLDNIADWLVHLGTVDQYRTPAVRFSPADRPDHIDAWLAANAGTRVAAALTNLAQFPTADLDQIVDGWTEQFDAGPVWSVEVSGSPASPYNVAVIEGTGPPTQPAWRLNGTDSTLAAAVDGDDTTLRVATGTGPPWSTTAGNPTDLPFTIGLAGEQVTVTAVTTATPAFIAAGTAAHANNTSVAPSLPAGMTVDVGQALLCWAAIRNSGTGTVNVPDGWTSLVDFGNTRLMGRYYITGVTAPTVTFTGGAANATCSAQLFGWSGLSLHTEFTTTQLNASAQDIATPAAPAGTRSHRRTNRMLLWAAWKQDDWTSAAVLGGGFATEAAEASTTTGDDQAIVVDYYMQATPAASGAGTIAITGGAAAISRAVLVALRPLQTFTVTRAVNGVEKTHPLGTSVGLWEPPVIAL